MVRSLRLTLLTAVVLNAEEVCAPCHPKQVAAFRESPMGRAISKPVDLAAKFTHAVSGTRFSIASSDGITQQTAERGGITSTHRIAYVIGSGAHAKGLLVRIGESLFQSPAAFYGGKSKWDVAPGYEQMTHPDTNRRATAECLACHANGGEREPGPISCDRCHGDGAAHSRLPSRANVRNPSRMSPVARASVCEQCHLTGEARVLAPGRTFETFSAGDVLEDHWSVFVRTGPRQDLRVVSHVEQLALSSCARASAGRLWCGTCHAPHGEKIDVGGQCASCHPALSGKHPKGDDCASCHMPKRDAIDGGHSAFTDHRIRRPGSVPTSFAGADGLRPWRPIANRDLAERSHGLAAIIAGERTGDAALINDGFRRLGAVVSKFDKDADVLASLGMVLLLKDQTQDAVKTLRAAVAARPADAAIREKLAIALRAAGEATSARAELEEAIRLEPTRESAYHLLASMAASAGERRQTLERFLRVSPESLVTREAIRALPRP